MERRIYKRASTVMTRKLQSYQVCSKVKLVQEIGKNYKTLKTYD